MKVGDEVTVQSGGEIVESVITKTDNIGSCGYVVVNPKAEAHGHILSFNKGGFLSPPHWIVGLDNGAIVRVRA